MLTATESEGPTSARGVTGSTRRREEVSGHGTFNSYGADPQTRVSLKTQACSTQSEQQPVKVPLGDFEQSGERAQMIV